MKEQNSKTFKRAQKIAERWRRTLACHDTEISKAEIQLDLARIRRSFDIKEKIYPELSFKQHEALYQILLKMKDQVLQKRNGKNKILTSFRLSQEVRWKLENLAERGGVSMTTVIENLVLNAKKFEIAIPEEK